MKRSDLLGKKVFDKVQHLEKLNINHAWICCALFNTFLEKRYSTEDISLAIDSCIRQMKEYVTKKTEAGFVRAAVMDHHGPFMYAGIAIGAVASYGIAKPAAVAAIPTATTATAASGVLASNIVAPMVALGITIVLMTIVLSVKGYSRSKATKAQNMMAVVEQMETLLKETLGLIVKDIDTRRKGMEPISAITITKPFFDEIVMQMVNSGPNGFIKGTTIVVDENEEFIGAQYMLELYRDARPDYLRMSIVPRFEENDLNKFRSYYLN